MNVRVTRMVKMRFVAAACVLGATLALSACESASISNLLGSSSPADEEFDTVKRPPLAMPPDFNLRPPAPGSTADKDVAATYYARQAVFGAKPKDATVVRKDGRTAGETALLQRAGVNRKDPGVRKVLDKETDELIEREKAFVDQILKGDKAKDGEDAEDDSDGFLGVFGGKPKPVIQKKDEGLIDSLFN